MDEQAERIKEALDEFFQYKRVYTSQDFEDIFEDRDPFEFL
jgi:hypothetical protein